MNQPFTYSRKVRTLSKSPTGITGLDEITGGGLPKGRTALITGSTGCGKTLFAMEFLVNGILKYDEPAVFVAFEEDAQELSDNVASLGFDLKELIRERKLVIDSVRVDPSEMSETGEYDLDGLFIRLGYAIDQIGAKRVALDTLDVLFSAMHSQSVLRTELNRLFRWLKRKGVTAVVTAERDQAALSRYGLEEYVADCVILLDHRVNEQVSTRWLRIIKYRGTVHGTNEYPFLIGKDGISVLPITSLGLDHQVSSERVSSGIAGLDEMLEGKGFYQGTSILISGTAGTGKTSLACSMVNAACERGETCFYFAFEESPAQILRNMKSIGIDLGPHVKNNLLHFQGARPTFYGLEVHLVTIHDMVNEFQPKIVVLDPIDDFTSIGTTKEVKSAITRVIDFLKTKNVTAVFTTTLSPESLDTSVVGISSQIDSWVGLRNQESNGERHRAIYILKSRGMAHSNQIRPINLTANGIKIFSIPQNR